MTEEDDEEEDEDDEENKDEDDDEVDSSPNAGCPFPSLPSSSLQSMSFDMVILGVTNPDGDDDGGLDGVDDGMTSTDLEVVVDVESLSNDCTLLESARLLVSSSSATPPSSSSEGICFGCV